LRFASARRHYTPAIRHRCASRNDVLAYERFTQDEKFTIALNLTHEPRRIEGVSKGEIAISTLLDRSGRSAIRHHLLRLNEGVLIKMS
jgi:hypothetical protein